MPRDVTDTDGTTWSCVQAYAGLSDEAPAKTPPKSQEPVAVVCTPSGGAQTVRLSLPPDWETAMDDAELVKAIEAERA